MLLTPDGGAPILPQAAPPDIPLPKPQLPEPLPQSHPTPMETAMLKTILTAAALTLTAGLASAAGLSDDLAVQSSILDGTRTFEELGYYCEWVTVYDGWGNWVTLYQCF